MIMELIQDSAEHYFLTRLDELKGKPANWCCLYFSMSKLLAHDELIYDLSEIKGRIDAACAQRDVFVEALVTALENRFEGEICVFKDMDVFALVRVETSCSKKALEEVFRAMAKKLPKGMSDMDELCNQARSYQKLADDKILSAKRFESYEKMADKHKVLSISARRKRRDEPVVMVVEDDRFTAYYASTILSTDFDFVLSKSGESAVQDYIEYAPDIVFLDIHLPGLNGHEVLQAINAVDPKAFVVMLSVDSVRDNIMQASTMGARKFLKKPFTKERLIETVKHSPHVRQLMRSDRAGCQQLFH